MLNYHPLTDEFAQYKLAYGLGLEGRWGSTGTGQPFDVCGLEAYGHAGLDYGSGAMLSFYLPLLRLGISLATTSAARRGGATAGMNCSRPYKQLQYAVSTGQGALVLASAHHGACPSPQVRGECGPGRARACRLRGRGHGLHLPSGQLHSTIRGRV